jgi:(E)-4-hydroxy-3-methyl-but-2-enyl pyrophosphate reductase
MGVNLAKTAGFCMGVKRAVDMVLDVVHDRDTGKIYTYGPLIHNPQTVEILKKRGILPIDNIDDIEEGTIIIRAHGISPLERKKIKEKNVKIVDVTCPKVARVQAIIKKHASLGYTIVIVGDNGHPEVDGLLGYSDGKGVVIENRGEVDALPELEKICVVAQTTQSKKEYEDIIDRIRQRFQHVTVFDTICDSTEKRQAEVKNLSAEMDAMFVVGGKNSANTKRLATMSELQGTPTFHIETADELKNINIDRYSEIGISAGASTPNWTIEKVVDYITSFQEEKKRGKASKLLKFWIFAIITDIYSAVGAGFLSLASSLLQGLSVNILNILTASFYVYSMHALNRFTDRKYIGIISSFREDSYLEHDTMYFTSAILSLLAALTLSFVAGIAPFLLLLSISSFGVLYNAKIFSRNWRFRRLRDLPGSKNISVATAWAIVIAVFPQLEISISITPAMTFAFLFTFAVVFVRSALSDTIDIQSDRLIGRETIPVVIGKENTQKLLKGISLITAALLIIVSPAGWTSSLSFALLACVFYMWICFKLCDRRSTFSGVVLEGLLETNYIIAGLMTFLWLVFV